MSVIQKSVKKEIVEEGVREESVKKELDQQSATKKTINLLFLNDNNILHKFPHLNALIFYTNCSHLLRALTSSSATEN